MNDRCEYREKKPRDTDAVEYDLLPAAELPPAEIVSADKINGKAERKIAVSVHDYRGDDRAYPRRDKRAEQGKLRQKKGEDKRQQEEVPRERFVLNNRTQQRDEQIQSHDHVEEPQVIMSCDELRKDIKERAAAKNEADECVAARPENEYAGHAQHILFQYGADRGIAA